MFLYVCRCPQYTWTPATRADSKLVLITMCYMCYYVSVFVSICFVYACSTRAESRLHSCCRHRPERSIAVTCARVTTKGTLWLRTNGVNTDGGRPKKKSLCQENMQFAVTPSVLTPFVPFLNELKVYHIISQYINLYSEPCTRSGRP